MRVFDYTIFLYGDCCGRRFGKTAAFTQMYLTAAVIAMNIGNCMYPEMSKKHREMLNQTFIDYIPKRLKELKK